MSNKAQTIEEIIYGCWLGGCSLRQRLATIDGSGLPKLIEEARLIREHLDKDQEERDAIWLKAVNRSRRASSR